LSRWVADGCQSPQPGGFEGFGLAEVEETSKGALSCRWPAWSDGRCIWY
jgi:hypothetical protein